MRWNNKCWTWLTLGDGGWFIPSFDIAFLYMCFSRLAISTCVLSALTSVISTLLFRSLSVISIFSLSNFSFSSSLFSAKKNISYSKSSFYSSTHRRARFSSFHVILTSSDSLNLFSIKVSSFFIVTSSCLSSFACFRHPDVSHFSQLEPNWQRGDNWDAGVG